MFTEQDAEQAALERETLKDWRIVNRLSAVIAYAAHPAKEVAKIFNVTTVTVINWAHAFHTKGVNGLRDAGKGHRARKLSGKNAETVRDWIVTSKNAKGKRVHWTLKRLCIEIKSELGIDIACSSLSETLAEMKLVIKRPRPMNYKYDPQKADDFKKKPQK